MTDRHDAADFLTDDDYLEIDNLEDFSVSGSDEYVPSSSPSSESCEDESKKKKIKRKNESKMSRIRQETRGSPVPCPSSEVPTSVSETVLNQPISNENRSAMNNENMPSVTITEDNNAQENSNSTSSSDDICFGPIPRPKKRRYAEPGKWRRNIRKNKRNSGQTYITEKGKINPAKNCKDFNCNCRLSCNDKITFQQCCENFKTFYSNASWETQTAYIMNSVKVVSTKRKQKNTESRRGQTREYYLKAGKEDVLVCKSKYMQTLNIDSARIHRALIKYETQDVTDKRGKHAAVNKTSDAKLADVHNHIKSFPAYSSHYRRHDTPDSLYLPIELNTAKMYQMYKDKMKEKYIRDYNENRKEWLTKCVSLTSYKRIFRRDFNLKFKPPKKDTCKTCDKIKVQMDAVKLNKDLNFNLQSLQVEQELHHRQVDQATVVREEDIKAADTGLVHVVSFDLQKTFPLPKLSTNEAYYKRQLCIFNLGIHNLSSQQAFMHIWHEGVASRGAQEISSCLMYYIKSHVNSEKLIMWSDACGGQNRNVKMVLAMMYTVAQENCSVNEIVHKFCISGHSYMANDRDFSQVENKVRQVSNIYCYDYFVDIVKSCKQNKLQFIVKTMEGSDFTSTKSLECMTTNRKKDSTKEQVQWLRMRETRVLKSKPGVLFYKYSHNPEVAYFEVDFRKKLSGPSPDFSDCTLEQLYPNGHIISKPKLEDINHLLKYVPPVNHRFFLDLKCSNDVTVIDDIDGLPRELDFDPEEEKE